MLTYNKLPQNLPLKNQNANNQLVKNIFVTQRGLEPPTLRAEI